MKQHAAPLETLGPALLGRLPPAVRGPGYDRAALRAGMAHIGVGAFHRCHQAEYADDMLECESGRWGIVGINIRQPRLAETLGRQSGLYTRLIRDVSRLEARVVGSIVSVVDSQDSAAPALDVLASPQIDIVTLTVTEKGYCHRPASGELDLTHPDIVHDIANPDSPRSVPGIILRALDLRMRSHGRPITLVSCDNILSNGVVLGHVVCALAERRPGELPEWIDRNAAFPSTMVDRIAPATTPEDIAAVQQTFGYRDDAVVVGEPFRQWVIENRFAGRVPPWDRAGAAFTDDVTAHEHLKMRVLNGAQTTLSYLGVLAGHEHTSDDMTDPLLVQFVRRMLVEESLPTLAPIPGVSSLAYIDQSLDRLRNTAIRHRNHQIATDGSQKIVQRLLNPIRERLRRGDGVVLLSVSVAAWMVYLIRASKRFGQAWTVDDPFAGKVAAIADRIGNDPAALVDAILAMDAIFHAELAASGVFRSSLIAALRSLMSADPLAYVRSVTATAAGAQLNSPVQTA